jgi:hypothetical protein
MAERTAEGIVRSGTLQADTPTNCRIVKSVQREIKKSLALITIGIASPTVYQHYLSYVSVKYG